MNPGGLFPEDLGGGDFDLQVTDQVHKTGLLHPIGHSCTGRVQDADERFMAQMYLNTATACHTQPKLLLGKKPPLEP